MTTTPGQPENGPHRRPDAPGPGGAPVLSVRDLRKEFPIRTEGLVPRTIGAVKAVDGVSFDLYPGETLALVGESGCGKSTTGRCILRLIEPTSGSVTYNGRDVLAMQARELRTLRRNLQIVFQDPYASLNPRLSIGSLLTEPMMLHGAGKREAQARARDLLDLVRLRPEHMNRFPHEFSGGQRQRIGIARSLALDPDVLILDEPVSALDVSIQAGVLNLLTKLQDELRLAYLFIAHDLSVVRHIADRVAVMYLGRIVEIGTRDEVYTSPSHPYTQALLSAAPLPDPLLERRRKRIVLTGDVPNPANPPSGCHFRTRCWKAQDKCATQDPELIRRSTSHPAACHFAEATEVIPG